MNQSATTVKTYRTADELEEVRAFWQAFQHHPNSDYDHFRLICHSRPEVLGPCVIALSRAGGTKVLIASRREESVFRGSVAYARMPGISSRILNVIYRGIIGTPDRDDGTLIAEEFLRLLKRGEADVVNVNLLPQDCALWEAFEALPLRATGRPVWATHRRLRLAPTKGFLLQNMRSKHRSWIRRKESELQAAFPDGVSWHWHVASVEGVAALCERMEQVSRSTYQRGLGAGFIDNEETRSRLRLFAERGMLRILVLEAAGAPQAFWLGEVYKGVFHSEATAYNQDLRKFEVGTLLLLRLVDLLVDESVEQFDFGLGDAQYKERFGDQSWLEASFRIYAPTFKGALLWSMETTANAADRLLRFAAARFGGIDRVKSLWRKWLHNRASRESSSGS